MTKKAIGNRRPYAPGEDLVKYREGVIVCQGPGSVGRSRICARPVRKIGRFRIVGGWHDVYECDWGKHRFGIRGAARESLGDRTVIDIATERPTFGELP